MSAGKKIAVTFVVLAAVGAAGFGGYKVWKSKGGETLKGVVYVQPVQQVNTAAGMSLTGSLFSGVIETQKTEDFKYDTTKKIKALKVEVGDEVKKGDVLFTYDTEAMQLAIDEAELEYEKTQNTIETNKIKLAEYQKEKAKATADNQLSLTTEILALQSDIARDEYDVKAKASNIEKMKANLKKNKVKSTLDGIVKSVADIDNLDTLEGGVIVSISRGDDYTVKGTVNEQMIRQIYKDMPVVIRSRIDDTQTWHGVISSIETKPQTNSNSEDYYMGEEDSGTASSKYNFYVKPESLDGLMLGQHIIIEPDLGIDYEDTGKDGIWLASDFVVEQDGKYYVWAVDGREKLEFREVKIGKTEEDYGYAEYEITEGLEKTDKIAYPSDQFKAGMKTTDNYEEANVPEYDEDDYDDGDIGMADEDGDYDFDFGDEDYDFDDEDAAFEEDEEFVVLE